MLSHFSPVAIPFLSLLVNTEEAEKQSFDSPSSQKPSQPLFDSSPATHHVTFTMADWMKKLCSNGHQTEKLSQTVEELRGVILSLQLDNAAPGKEIEASE